MKKFLILKLLMLLVVVSAGIWYNFSSDNSGARIQAIEGPPGPERRFAPGEIVVCVQEIPIGEAIEGAMDFACRLSKALANIQWATNQYRRTVVEIADLASQCDSRFCQPSCTLNDKGTPDDETDDVCIPNPCWGDPCWQREEIETKYQQLAALSRIIARGKATINILLNESGPEIREKLDEARRLFEKNAPTVELYQLLRGPTPCEIAIKNFWVELQDVQDKKVCKSLYNWLICR